MLKSHPYSSPMDSMEITKSLIRLALAEDIGSGDLTAKAVPETKMAVAKLVAKQACTVTGLELAQIIIKEFSTSIQLTVTNGIRDGAEVSSGTVLLLLQGPARELLTVERTLLNFLQKLMGVATEARKYSAALGASKLTILDTRKTTPGLRFWEKKAVKDGGLQNHRQRLDDGILVKENHIRAAGGITQAIQNLKSSLPCEVEVTCWDEAKEAIDQGILRLLLDNFSVEGLKVVVPKIRAYKTGMFLEASGGIQLNALRSYAETGIDAVSVGALTHSPAAADLSLLFEFQGR